METHLGREPLGFPLVAPSTLELKGRMAKVELGLDDMKRMLEKMLSEPQET